MTLIGSAAAAYSASWPRPARAQPRKIFRIGFVGLPTADSLPKRPEAFRAALRDLGIRRDAISSSTSVGRTATTTGFPRCLPTSYASIRM
jgi:hypothetical protein